MVVGPVTRLLLLAFLVGFSHEHQGLPILRGRWSVLAFNVQYDSRAPQQSLDAIARADADVVCLRELTPSFSDEVVAAVGARYPYRSLHPTRGTWGVGLLSKKPIVHAVVFEESPHTLPALEATIEGVLVSCVHLFPPVGKHRAEDDALVTYAKNEVLRTQQARELMRRYRLTGPTSDQQDRRRTRPVVVLGDFNEGPGGGAAEALRAAGFVRACDVAERRCGATFRGVDFALPAFVEIDHIFGRGVTFRAASVVRAGGADHLPVLASFDVE